MPPLLMVTRSNSLLDKATSELQASYFSHVGIGTHRVGMGARRPDEGTAHLMGCVETTWTVGSFARWGAGAVELAAVDAAEDGVPEEPRTSRGVAELTNNISCACSGAPRVRFVLFWVSSFLQQYLKIMQLLRGTTANAREPQIHGEGKTKCRGCCFWSLSTASCSSTLIICGSAGAKTLPIPMTPMAIESSPSMSLMLSRTDCPNVADAFNFD